MEYILNARQMKQCDSDTIHKIGIPSMVLMERAALCVVDEMERYGCDLHSVLVVCGSGNNGGDGFAIARLLHEKHKKVTLAFVGRDASLTEETALQKRICENCGIKISSNFQDHEYTTIVDAVFGIGLSRAIEGRYAEVINWMNQQRAVRVAVDLPSGIGTDNGKIMGVAVEADLTVTFACRKIGHILYPGAGYCGKVVCRDIGIPVQADPACIFTYDRADLQRIPYRPPYSNKGTFGRVLLIAGSEGMCGAACLAARAAYRAGSGLVQILTPECNRTVIQTYLPEAIVTVWEECLSEPEKLNKILSRADVTGIGPGLGIGNNAKKLLHHIMEHYNGPLVVDADGLNMISREPDLLQHTKAQVIVTPHVAEMARLIKGIRDSLQNEQILSSGPSKVKAAKENSFCEIKEEILRDLIGSARDFAKNQKIICVLKDARTVVSDGGRVYLNTSGNSGMAVGGSGDVLTGMICGLLAQKMQPFEAAIMGVYLHGLAGDAACEVEGPYGMLAGDIADHVGRIMQGRQISAGKQNAGTGTAAYKRMQEE